MTIENDFRSTDIELSSKKRVFLKNNGMQDIPLQKTPFLKSGRLCKIRLDTPGHSKNPDMSGQVRTSGNPSKSTQKEYFSKHILKKRLISATSFNITKMVFFCFTYLPFGPAFMYNQLNPNRIFRVPFIWYFLFLLNASIPHTVD